LTLEPEVTGGLLGELGDQIVGHFGEGLVDELVAARIVVRERHGFGEALATATMRSVSDCQASPCSSM
jgi:hypothetical protein